MLIRAGLLALTITLSACGPQLGSLQKGEEGRVVRVFTGDALQLESGQRVFLAEVDAPSGDQPYASQARAELEALALHRRVLLAYGGTHRWTPRPRPGETTPQAGAAIAHLFVQSEGGRWFWLQHALVARGAVMVRPRFDNHARARDLLAIETQARAAQRGLWGKTDYRVLAVRDAARAASTYNNGCTRGAAPYRLLEGTVHDAQISADRASLIMDGAPADVSFAIVLFGDSFSHWDGPALASLNGARLRVRGTLGVFRDQPQICLDDSRQLTVLRSAP